MTTTTKTTHGGKREGAGRKPEGRSYVQLRLSNEEHEALRRLGGSSWLQANLKAVVDGKADHLVNTSKWSEEDQQAFYDGFVAAGGPDEYQVDGPTPWGAPWLYEVNTKVRGTTPYEMGKSHWHNVREEYLRIACDEAVAFVKDYSDDEEERAALAKEVDLVIQKHFEFDASDEIREAIREALEVFELEDDEEE